ncbi:MAG: pilin [Patescibacteria group bacterium]|nr:pilin [Patescibacteria group bacterium]
MGYERMSHHIVKGTTRGKTRGTLVFTAVIIACSVICVLVATGTVSAADTTIESSVFEPLGPVSIPVIIGNIIRGLIGISGVLALAMFVYGGFMWMTSAGNKERVDKAKNTVVWSVLGLILIFASYALVSFVLSALGQ